MRAAFFASLAVMAIVGGFAFGNMALGADEPAAKPENTAQPENTTKPENSAKAEDAAQPDQAELERQFAAALSGATFVGNFTNSNQKDGKLKEERYTINEVRKLRDNVWLFNSRIQYGGKDAVVPLALEVKWAGDTPVITLTDFVVPGFGKFTCRVLVYRDHYAGTWDAGDHGGHLFGKIERAK
jgi:hypothetical protein